MVHVSFLALVVLLVPLVSASLEEFAGQKYKVCSCSDSTFGQLDDGSGSMNYLANFKCSYVIAPPKETGFNTIQLFIKGRMECGFDKLMVFSLEDFSGTPLHTLPEDLGKCSADPMRFETNIFIKTTEGVALFFVTDGSVTSEGWTVNYNSFFYNWDAYDGVLNPKYLSPAVLATSVDPRCAILQNPPVEEVIVPTPSPTLMPTPTAVKPTSTPVLKSVDSSEILNCSRSDAKYASWCNVVCNRVISGSRICPVTLCNCVSKNQVAITPAPTVKPTAKPKPTPTPPPRPTIQPTIRPTQRPPTPSPTPFPLDPCYPTDAYKSISGMKEWCRVNCAKTPRTSRSCPPKLCWCPIDVMRLASEHQEQQGAGWTHREMILGGLVVVVAAVAFIAFILYKYTVETSALERQPLLQ